MALGIYKPGQGYWMRVITAAMVGTLFLALAMWVAGQAKRVVVTLPASTYSLSVRTPAGSTFIPPAPGTQLTLRGGAQGGNEPPVIGTAVVSSYDVENRRLEVKAAQLSNANYQMSEAKSLLVEGAGGAAPVFAADITDLPRAKPIVEPILVQGICASIIIVIGAVLTYWACAIRPKTVDFLINTDMEMKKVNWSTRKDIVGSTWVVIGSAFLIAAFIFLADFIMQYVFRSIGVLQS